MVHDEQLIVSSVASGVREINSGAVAQGIVGMPGRGSRITSPDSGLSEARVQPRIVCADVAPDENSLAGIMGDRLIAMASENMNASRCDLGGSRFTGDDGTTDGSVTAPRYDIGMRGPPRDISRC